MRIFRRFSSYNLLVAWRDLRDFLRGRERYEFLCLAAALAITAFIIYAFWHDSRFERQEQIVYVNNWPANRSDAEIKKEITADSVARHKAMAERQAAFKRVQDQFGIK